MFYFHYFLYVLKHKWYVLVECWKHGLYWQGIIHDLSKFRPSEFIPYAQHFFSEENYPHEEVLFNRAVLHHYNRNKHHWSYWVQRDRDDHSQPLVMPKKYVKEMICDWQAMGKIHGNNAADWYYKVKDSILIHRTTEIRIENTLDRWGIEPTETEVTDSHKALEKGE